MPGVRRHWNGILMRCIPSPKRSEHCRLTARLVIDRGQNRSADQSRRRLGTQCERNYVISGIAPFCCPVQRANEAVKKAGAVDRLLYNAQHSEFIRRAIRDFPAAQPQRSFCGCRLAEAEPNVGDIVCWARPAGIDYDHQKGGDDQGHCGEPSLSSDRDASGARCTAGRLSRRSEVEIRDLAGLGLAVRDERGNGAQRPLRNARLAARDEDHHPPPGCDAPLLRKRRRTAVGSSG
jgi:hypothetical protein